MFKLRLLHPKKTCLELGESRLFNETTFYDALLKDLSNCAYEVLIESPFITSRRLAMMLSVLEKLKARQVRITINTRDPHEHDDDYMRAEAFKAIARLQHLGIHVLFTTGHHRKLAILDRNVLYEGSLNILSQNNSCEVMRRIESCQMAWQMAHFVKIDRFLQ